MSVQSTSGWRAVTCHIRVCCASALSNALLRTPCRWAAVDGGDDLHEVVEAELEAATGQRVDLEPEPRSGYGPDPT